MNKTILISLALFLLFTTLANATDYSQLCIVENCGERECASSGVNCEENPFICEAACKSGSSCDGSPIVSCPTPKANSHYVSDDYGCDSICLLCSFCGSGPPEGFCLRYIQCTSSGDCTYDCDTGYKYNGTDCRSCQLYVESNDQAGDNSDLSLTDLANATCYEDNYTASCAGKWYGENWYFEMYNSTDSGTIIYANATFYNIYANTNPSSDTFAIQCNKTDADPTDSGWSTLWSGTELWTSPQNLTYNITDLCGVTTFADINKTRFKITSTAKDGGEDTVTWYVDAINITYEKITDNPPTYSNNATNTTVADKPCNFTLDWDDDNGLSGYIFSTNNSGTWQNASFVSFSGISNTSWNVTTLNDTVGALVQWCYYANDTSDNWNTSENFSLVTTSGAVEELFKIKIKNATIYASISLFIFMFLILFKKYNKKEVR